ncbi:CaiB/BaiF CoA-transferase family protein [Sphingopyxis sp. JAI128]|uniref:CaiB/BaiF CoA transferase family protein n=1 Tax=Sphingopyxis sp. JAI128 TaxID=2723066 RepID=UPI00160E9FD1|nr:CaiB/BaiF CoA-transferase family protein [Sphingopyxis sp. JAI128]MBB6427900.1 alpha-methylacyl-CoA racemase [Sphingopyxis sp. JAI128]
MSGPLAGLRVLEFAGIGPGPHCGMLLADLGAEVVRIDRPGGNGWPNPVVDRGRSTVTIDIRSEEGRAFCYEAADKADVLIEGFRPGVMERLGFGPDILCERNPRLVYGRMTGWGQSGPLAQAAGHDINYIAVTGALAAMGTAGQPAMPPLNLVGDFGGGSMFLAFGIMAALWERQSSGRGQIIDAAIVDGVTSLMTMFAGLLPDGRISMARDSNLLAGASPFYRCYRCADGGEIAVGALEPQFYRELIALSGAPSDLLDQQNDESGWAGRSDRLADLFATRTVAEWCAMLEGSDACFAPVIELSSAPSHPHLAARETYVEADGLVQAASAPRFSRTPGTVRAAQPDGREAIARWPTQ